MASYLVGLTDILRDQTVFLLSPPVPRRQTPH
jgi:hypothetical protein